MCHMNRAMLRFLAPLPGSCSTTMAAGAGGGGHLNGQAFHGRASLCCQCALPQFASVCSPVGPPDQKPPCTDHSCQPLGPSSDTDVDDIVKPFYSRGIALESTFNRGQLHQAGCCCCQDLVELPGRAQSFLGLVLHGLDATEPG